MTDPSVAYDTVTGDFIACAMARDPGGQADDRLIVVSRYDASGNPPAFGAWEVLAQAPEEDSFDKPWIVDGEIVPGQPVGGLGPMGPGQEPTDDYQEFYITWSGEGRIKYLRSTDGGHNWIGGDALTDPNDPNSYITPVSTPAPAVFGDRPLYVVFEKDSGTLEFVRGVDINSGPHAGEVKFSRLLDPNDQVLSAPMNPTRDALYIVAPGPGHPNAGANGPGWQLAPDPTDAARLFLVYHDMATTDPFETDVNLYMRVLNRQGGRWSLGDVIPIVDSSVTEFESDQILPTVAVDEDGGIHVIFYDDRKYTDPDPNDPFEDQQPDNDATPQYDVWYAFVEFDQEIEAYVVRFNLELCDDPGNDCEDTEPAVNYDLPTSFFGLRDYVGIDIGADRVWTCFMGHSEQDTNDDQSVIWSTQITQP